MGEVISLSFSKATHDKDPISISIELSLLRMEGDQRASTGPIDFKTLFKI